MSEPTPAKRPRMTTGSPPRATSSVPLTGDAQLTVDQAVLELSPPPLAPLAPLLTTGEVAELLRLDVYTVRRLVSRGDLVAHRIGRQLRVDVGELGRYLDEHRATPSP